MQNTINAELGFLIDKIKNVEGDIVELGVYTGNNSIQFMWQTPQKKYIGFDTFKGYTQEDIETSPNKEGLIDNANRWNHDKDETIKRIQSFKDRFELGDFEIVEGDLKKTFPEYVESKKIKNIAMLYVDCNAYLPASVGIETAYPIMPPGSIICIDEHQTGGETKAILEASEKYGLEVIETGFKFISGPNSNPSKYMVKQ